MGPHRRSNSFPSVKPNSRFSVTLKQGTKFSNSRGQNSDSLNLVVPSDSSPMSHKSDTSCSCSRL
ncbi:hypothetical protein HanIR_Chr05g0229451 [Helianthus annuus]|nr:hypothetical protein HanIR_Chr05g0229451 [Helianthus annuus]